MRAGIYTRLSVERTGEGLAVQRQEQDCRAFATARGFDIVAVFVDDGKSAWKDGAHRPGYAALLDAMNAGQIDCVITWHTDRLARRLRNLLEYLDVAASKNVLTFTLKSGDIDISTPNGIMMAHIKGAVDEAYVSEARLKNMRARLQIAQNGGRHVTARPYGWEAGGLVVREPEAAIVRELVQRLTDGEPATRVALDLNSRNVPTVNGNVWTGIGVKKTALRPSNAAIREHHGVEYDGTWESIITRQQYEDLKLALSSRASLAYKRGVGRKYLLSGFAVCGICGSKLGVGAARSNSKSAYRCEGTKSHVAERVGCGKVVRHSLPLDHLVTEAVLYRLEGKPLLEAINQAQGASDEMRQLLDEADRQRKKVDRLVDEYATTQLWTPEQFARAKSAANARLSELERQISKQSYNRTLTSIDLTKTLRETWEAATLEWKRGLLEMLIDKVVVHPYPARGYKLTYYFIGEDRYRFNPELVDVIWKA